MLAALGIGEVCARAFHLAVNHLKSQVEAGTRFLILPARSNQLIPAASNKIFNQGLHFMNVYGYSEVTSPFRSRLITGDKPAEKRGIARLWCKGPYTGSKMAREKQTVENALGDALRALRRARDLKQKQIVELLGEKIGDRTLRAYEHGEELPSRDRLLKFLVRPDEVT